MCKRLIRILVVYFVCALTQKTEAQTFQKIFYAQSSGSDQARKISINYKNEYYTVGLFQGTFPIGSTTLSSAGSDDIFLIKYDCDGNVSWARRIGGSAAEIYPCVAVDELGGVYVSGGFTSTCTVTSNVSSGNILLTSSGSNDIFIAKYNDSGVLQWAHKAGGTGSDFSYGITSDSIGSVYIAGQFESTATFTTGSTSSSLTSSGSSDIFVASYSSVGSLQWAIKAGGSGTDLAFNISLDRFGILYVTGNYGNSGANASFGSITLPYNSGGWDGFVAKLNTNRSWVWVKNISGSSHQDADGGAQIDDMGNVYVAGNTVGSISTPSLSATYSNELYLIKYDSNGNYKWGRLYGGSYNDFARSLKIDPLFKYLYVVGDFYGTSYFGSKTLVGASTSTSDILLLIHDTSGSVVKAKKAGGSGSDIAIGIAFDTCNNPVISGGFQGNATFDAVSVNYTGSNNAYVAPLVDSFTKDLSFIGQDSILCNNQSDSIIVFLNNIPGASYQWRKDNVDISGANDSSLTIKAAGTYKVFIRYRCCYLDSSRSYNVVIAKPTLSTIDTTICQGDSTTLQPGTLQNYQFTWTPGSTLSDSAVRNPKAKPGTTTTYYVKAVNSLGCSTLDTLTVTILLPPSLNAGNDTFFCAGDSVRLTASGTGSFLWSPSYALSATNISNPRAKGLVDTSYIVRLTAASGCKNWDTIRVRVNQVPSLNAGRDTFLCLNDSVKLSATGTGAFKWSPSSSLSNDSISNPFSKATTTTGYYLRLTDTNGCINRDTVIVTVNSLPSLNAGPDTSYCASDSVRLNANGSGSWLWSPSSGLSNDTVANPIHKLNSAQTYNYIVKLKGNNGCYKYDTISVTVKAQPNTNAGTDTGFCLNDSIRLQGSGGVSYIWSPSSGLSDSTISNPVTHATTSITYALRATGSNGCSKTDSVRVNVYSLPTANAGRDTIICFNSLIGLSGSGSTFHLWRSLNGGSFSDSTISNPLFSKSGGKANSIQSIPIAYQSRNNSGCVDWDTMTIILKPDSSLPAPSLRCVSIINNKAVLSWLKPIGLEDFTEYSIYRRTGDTGSYVKVKTISDSSVITWTDSSVSDFNTKPYSYTLRSERTCNKTGQAGDTVNTILLGRSYISFEHANLSWNRLSTTAQTYLIEENASSAFSSIDSTTALNYPLVLKNCERSANYRISYRDPLSSCVSYSNPVYTRLKDSFPAAPARINFLTVDSDNIRLNIKKSDSADAMRYLIYKSANSLSPYLQDSISAFSSASVNWTDSFTDSRYNLYSYYIVVVDSCGNSSVASVLHRSMMMVADTTDCKQHVSLRWNKYINFPNGISSFKIYRSTVSASPVLRATLSGSDSTYVDTVSSYERYYYTVVATENITGYQSYSSDSSKKAFQPLAPIIYSVSKMNTSVGAGQMKIKWDKNVDPKINGFKLYVKANSSATYSLLQTFSTTEDSFIHSNLNTRDSDYYYYLIATDTCNNTGVPSIVHKSMNIRVDIGQLQHRVNWSPYLGFDSSIYVIEKFDGIAFQPVDSVSGDTIVSYFPAPCNVPIYYRIKAVNSNGAIAYSDTMGRPAIDTIYPNSVVTNNVSVVGNKHVHMEFTGSDSTDVYGYTIYRSDNGAGWTQAGFLLYQAPGVLIQFSDSNVNFANSFCYTIVTVDSCLNSKWSDTICPINLEGIPQNLADLLYWSPFKKYPVKKYVIEHLLNGIWTDLDSVSSGTLSYTHSPLACRVTQYYRIRAEELGGSRVSYSDSIILTPFDTIIPRVPFIKYATVLNDNDIQIFWKSSDPKVLQYELQMKSSSGSWISLDTIDLDTQYMATGLYNKDSSYCFRVVAIDSCQLNRSAPSPAHCTMQLKGLAQNTANSLNWTAYSGFQPVRKYYIELLSSGVWSRVDSSSSGILNYIHGPITCNIPKTYRIAALDSADLWISHSDTITLTPFDTIKPKAPDLRYVTVLNTSSIQFQWSLSDPKVLIYEIQLKRSGSNWVAIDTIGIDSNYTLTGLNTLDSSYCIRIVAIDSCQGNRSASSDEHCTIQLRGTPRNLSNFLNWNKYKGFNPVVKYYVQKNIAGSWTSIDSLNPVDSSYIHTALPCNITQFYRIKAIDASGYISYSDTAAVTPFDTIKPPPVKLLSANVTGSGSVMLTWSRSTAGDVLYYDVYRSSNGSSYSRIVTVVKDTFLLQTGLNTQDSTWWYHVVAIDSCNLLNRSVPSDIDHITHLKDPITGGCVPLINLSWLPYYGFNGDLVQNIERSENGENFSAIKTLGASDSTLIDSVPSRSSTYCYRIRNVNNITGAVSYSDTICMIPLVFPIPSPAKLLSTTATATGTSNGENEITWERSPVADTFARGYKIYHDNGSGSLQLIRTEPNLNVLSYRHKNINTRSGINKYLLSIYNLCDLEGDSSSMHRTINLDLNKLNLGASMNWTGYQGFPVSFYEVLRIENFQAAQVIYKGGDSSFTDTTQRCGNFYSYMVRAYDTVNNLVSSSDTVRMIAFDSIPPAQPVILGVSIIQTSQNIGKARLTFTHTPEKNLRMYRVYRKTDLGAFALIYTIYDVTSNVLTFDDAGLNTKTFNYNYYVQAIDSCNNLSLPAKIHRSIFLTATATDNANVISWNNYPEWTSYDFTLQRRTAGGSWSSIATLPSGTLGYSDSQTDCDTVYYYRIMALNTLDPFTIYSSEDSAKAFELTPPNVNEFIKVTVTQTGVINGTIQLDWNLSSSPDVAAYNIFRRVQNNPNWNLVAANYKGNTYTDKNLNTVNLFYDYRIQAIDSCRNVSATFSGEHRSIHLKVTPANESNSLSWNSYQGWSPGAYNIYRGPDLLTSVAGTALSYVDTMVRCDNTYTYRVEAVNDTNALISSFSNYDDSRPYDITGAPPMSLRYVSVYEHDTVVEISWEPSPKGDVIYYELYRSIAGNNWKLLYTSPGLSTLLYYDTIRIQKRNICYTIVAVDLCGNRSIFSNLGCVINPDAAPVKQSIHLNWNPYIDWPLGVSEYLIYRSDDNGPFTYVGNSDVPNYVDDALPANVKLFNYRVEAVENSGGAVISRSTLSSVHQRPTLYVPTAFSPNGDDLNDLFGPEGTWYESFTMSVFNRWGEEVFVTRNSQFWDGTYNGSELPDGVYFYIMTIKGYEGHKYYLKGDILLTR